MMEITESVGHKEEEDYFAILPTNEIIEQLQTKLKDYNDFLLTSGIMYNYRNAYKKYYQQLWIGGQMYKTGEQGQFDNLSVNQYRSILQSLKSIITQQRPSFECVATNTDVKSDAQTILAAGLLDYYMKVKRLDRHLNEAVEWCLLFGEGFVVPEWDTSLGDDYAVDENGYKIKTGDIRFSVFCPIDVCRNFNVKNSYDHQWYITTKYVPRDSLAADNPHLKDKILQIPETTDEIRNLYIYQLPYQKSDLIPYYTFYHAKTKALPNGRIVEFCDEDTIFVDSILPYEEVPVYRIAQSDQLNTPFGFTVGSDLLPLQQALDGLYSTVITNQANFGVQNVTVERGAGIEASSLVGGMTLIEYNQGSHPPAALNLTQTPQEVFSFIGSLQTQIETLSGVNSVVRGQPNENLKSGSALALVQAQAVQFNSGLQQSYINLLEDVGRAIINILQEFAQTPRVAMIMGKSNKYLAREWSKDDLSNIQRVIVSVGNPVTNTAAGRLNIAESLLQKGLITSPDQYIMALETGKVEPMIEGKQAELIHIREENEYMSEGHTPTAVFTDNHQLHIQEHRNVLASVEVREKHPEIITAVQQHIQQHIHLLQTTDPEVLQMLKEQPLPPEPPQNQGGMPAQQPINPAAELGNPMTQQPQMKPPKLPQPAKPRGVYQ